MRSKRLLAMLLSLCLMLSCLAPTANAVEASAESLSGAVTTAEADKTTVSSKENSLVASEENATGPNTLRDQQDLGVEAVTRIDQEQVDWQITAGQKPDLDLVQNETPACIEELKEVSSLYSVDEVVRAIIVLEDAPLAQNYTSPLLVSESLERQLIEKQDAVIASVERTVLQGQKLNVRYQFTYLANAISIETEFANLEKIAMIKGVKSVFVTPVYEACETVSDPNTSASGAMTGVQTVWENLGYTGEGMKIAIIDTGLDLDHPSFAALSSEMVDSNENYLSIEDIDAVLEDLNAYQYRSTIQAKNLYRSTKVPYAFNYVDSNMTADHSSDDQGDHGTHVAGIAAANKTEGTSVVGMAPDAQLIIMKVFGAAGGAYTDDIVAALEDAMTLGCDVVNASLGSPAGFSQSGADWVEEVYEMIAYQNIIATISAGNEGTSSYDNMWGTDLNNTKNPDNATIGSPSLYANAFSIASAENCEVQTPYFSLADGTKVFFNNDTYASYYGGVSGMEVLIGQEVEYVFIDGLGKLEDYYDAEGNSLVEGKVAVVRRGVETFFDKIYNAELAGAIACVIANNTDTEDPFLILMSNYAQDASGNVFFPSIPSCMISMEDGDIMAADEGNTLCVSAETAARIVEGGQMSSFSSWGVSPDLRLVPDITGIGGNVYSCYDGGNYGIMSGTSMSAPQLAGISALIMQYLYEKYPAERGYNDGYISDMARAILMSTADPIISTDSGVEASPRQQGAGLVNAAEAVKTTSYLTVDGGRPKAELGDSKTGVYSFTFEIHNFSQESETYTLSSSLLTEDVVDYYGIGEYFMAGYDVALSGNVTFSINDLAPASADEEFTVTVGSGETVEITVTITLSDEDKVMFARYWENGGYVEGFVYLDNADEYGVDLNLPFLGFYGDWTQAPVFDTAYWYDNSFWGADPVDGLPEGDEYYHVLWTDLGGTDYVLGFNPYSGAYVDYTGQIVYDPANNSVSPNGDGVLDGLSEIYLSLMRNAKMLTFTYTDAATGEILHRETIENASKTMYRSSYGQIIPWLYSWYGSSLYDFKGVENGTTVLLTIEGSVDYELGGDHAIQIPITVDTEAPKLLEAYQITEEDGSHSLVVIAEDNVNVAAIFLMNRSGTQVYAEDYCFEARADGTYMATFNVDGLGTELTVCVGDYAANEGYYNITYTKAGDNLPELDSDLLYGYRSFDYNIQYYQGYDYMFGWQAMNKPEDDAYGYVWLEPLTNDYMEYYALTAAEYAGGKIFAVDSGYNLVVMDPGLWNRTTICNLGVNVLDMTFDDSTDTMYVLGKVDSYYVYLYALDLMTGELSEVKYYGTYNRAPYAITDDDNGTLYAIKQGDSKLYTLTAENSWAMQAITDADGNNLVIYDSAGSKVNPNYAQSMTYSDGTIYWAYFKYSDYYGPTGEIIAIETADMSYTNAPVITYYSFAGVTEGWYQSQPEFVGLLTIEETEYQLPEADALEAIAMSQESVVLMPGQSSTVSAMATPWNYTLGELTWTSSDESVATVEDGKITAVSEGMAYITVTTEGLSAQCAVIVVDTATTFNAYNYYSEDGYYGYMIEVDTGIMDYYLEAESPVDWLAGDYNGNDGYFYGYSEGGQFWRYDPETGKAIKLGDPIGSAPMDMAYDYSTGKMYAITTVSYGWESVGALNVVDLNTGAMEMVYMDYYIMMTLACGPDGSLYTITADGMLLKLSYVYDDWYEEYSWMPELLMMDLGYLQYMQSMCYDYANDVLIWAYCETGSLVWLDPNNGYAINLGDPTGSGMFEFVGMYTVPETIPELPDVAVEYAYVADMMMLADSVKYPSITIYPTNATCQDIDWTSSDTGVVAVTEEGFLKGVSAGTAVISGVLEDTVSGETYDLSFTVTVLQGADDLYGHLMTDVATYGGQTWLRLYPTDPSNPDYLEFTDYILYAEEYYDGKLYAYGYDPNDWSGSWQYFVMDPDSREILEQKSMDDAFPFVYDMTYDYTTSTMYCVAGAGSDDSDLYAIDMETGELILLMTTDEFFMSLTASPDGTLYAMEQSQMDEYDGSVLSAQLYTIDPISGTVEWFADTGIQSNMLVSMTYDYDTDYIYWSAFAQTTGYTGGLCLIDPATGVVTNLGPIGAAGAQVSGLYTICENFPEESDPELQALLMDNSKTVVNVGSTVKISANTLPVGLDAQITWTTSDETIATVDNGVVTGVAQGKAVITATATYNGKTLTAECEVAVLTADAAFLTWNKTDMGWSSISRADYSVVTNLTEGEELGVQAIAAVGDDVYGYDDNGNLFKLNTKTFARELIGASLNDTLIANFMANAGVTEEDYPLDLFAAEVRDMAYDVANNRMLILTGVLMYEEWYEGYGEFSETTMGNSIYAVDLTTGEITEKFIFEEYYYVYGLTVDADGTVYFYTTANDYVNELDMETGVATLLVSLQTQSLYGEYGQGMHHAMYYDALTDMLYMQFTSNGKFYRMVTINPNTGALSAVTEDGSAAYIGSVEYDYDSWAYVGDSFAGMTFVEIPEPVYEADFIGASMGLNGTLDLRFYAALSEDLVASEDVSVLFTVNGKSEIVALEDAVSTTVNDQQCYVFTVKLAAKQMADEVTAQVMMGEEPVGEARAYSIKQYAEAKIANANSSEDLVTLMKAMLNYGAAAQEFFDYNTENPANDGLADADKVLPTVDVSSYAHSITGSEDGIKAVGASLELASENAIRVYFKLTGDKTIEEYTFTVDGEIAVPVIIDGKYCIEIRGIDAKGLDEMHTVAVGGLSVEYCGLSYANQVLKSSSSAQEKIDLVTALYLYNQAANEFFKVE